MAHVDRSEFKKRIADCLMVSEESIQDDTNFYYDLEVDSLKMLKLINLIECSYSIEIDDAKIGSLATFAAAYAYVNDLCKWRSDA